MKYELAYGNKQLGAELPDRAQIEMIEARASTPITNVEQAIREALAHPIGSMPFSEIIKPGEKVMIVVSDVTRLWTRTDLVLPVLLEVLNEMGVPDQDISIVTATGDHRGQTCEERHAICGEAVLKRVKIFDHDCLAGDLVDLGVSRQGTVIKVNRQVWEADRVILTGGITYHMLAGFGGGRKSLAPGVCGYETIQQNHGLALKGGGSSGINPKVGTGIIEGNPVAEDMLEIAQKIGADFIVNGVVNARKEFVFIAAGEMQQAHLRGCRVVEEIFGIPMDHEADLVIAGSGGFPKDIQLYQSIKALDNAAYAVREGGVIILVSECSDGVGSRPFLEFFAQGEVEQMNAALHANFSMPGFVALRTASTCRRSPVILVSSLADDVAKEVRMLPAHSLAEALHLAEKILGRSAKTIYLMPHASTTFPIMR